MIKRICFFTVGFAFNRLVRMRFYEKIFPKDVEIFLVTTNKYHGREKEMYQQEYDLKRTKVVTLDYNLLKLPFMLRKFCKENKIDRIMNVGGHFSALFFLFATIFTKTDYFVNILADMFNQYKLAETIPESFKYLLSIMLTFPLILFAKKTTFTDGINYKRASVIFLTPRKKRAFLAAPLNINLFKIKDKIKSRKKLKLPLNKKIIIYVGRISFTRCSDFLKKFIKKYPEFYFIIIGRLMDEDFLKDKELIRLKNKNYELLPMKSSKELVDYYNASDLGLCVNREGGGPGLIAEEAMACGVPIVVSEWFRLKKSEALYQVPLKFEAMDDVITNFFKLSKEERKRLPKIAREYIKKNYSNEVWEEEYKRVYLDKIC